MENKNKYLLPVSFFISAILISAAFIYSAGLKSKEGTNSPGSVASANKSGESNFREITAPPQGTELPVKWGDLGKKMVEAGVIDSEQIKAIYDKRGGLSEEDRNLIFGDDNGNLVITPKNSGLILNMLWALGLANKNEILEKGPMQNYGDASKFASTGGWSLAKGSAMNYYSSREFVKLTRAQQDLVEKVSKNIYRPCCDNSTYFPDCNHGMAMLGFLQLMSSQGVGENDMYRAALVLNSYWFPDNYATIAKYFKQKGVDWDKVDAKNILSEEFSSISGYENIVSKITEPKENKGGGGCGV